MSGPFVPDAALAAGSLRTARRVGLALLGTLLGSCSYSYQLLATVTNGQLTFVVSPASDQTPSCVRQVEVLAENYTQARAQEGDDRMRLGYGTFWFESVDYDAACANHFPLIYGAALDGAPMRDGGHVAPKPLVRELIYRVSTTTGATGYGQGRFVVHADGRVENLPGPGNVAGNAAGPR